MGRAQYAATPNQMLQNTAQTTTGPIQARVVINTYVVYIYQKAKVGLQKSNIKLKDYLAPLSSYKG